MRAIRQTVRVLPGGRIEITDAALVAGVEAEVVVLLPEPSGDGSDTHPEAPRSDATWPLLDIDADGLAIPAPRDPNRPRVDLVDLIGFRPSGRTAEEIDREIRDFRGDDADVL